jgi:hypothetical protein
MQFLDLGQFRRFSKSILGSIGSPNTTKEKKLLVVVKLERKILNYSRNTSYNNSNKISP